jgi:ABC-type glycerol-3-phosphate transport system substrate-binding protein
MKRILLMTVLAGVFMACGNGSESADGSDTTVSSTTPPAKADTNPIGIMMGDTTIGINDSLK